MKVYVYFVIFTIIAMSISMSTANTCGGNCPGNACTTCLCGTTANQQNIATWCAKYSWSQSCCQCIVQKESAGNANAQNHNSNGSDDIGLWQINDFNWGQCNNGNAPCDPTQNLNCAIKVYQWGGNTWKNWATASACGCANSP